MVYVFFDLGLLILIFLIVIIAGGNASSYGLYEFLDSNFSSVITIFVVIHLIFWIISNIKLLYKNTIKSKTVLVLGNLLYTIGKAIRIVTETCFFACLFQSFLTNYSDSHSFIGRAFLFFAFLLEFTIVGITSFASGVIDLFTICIYDLIYHEDPYLKKDEHTDEDVYKDEALSILIVAIISIVLSIILFLLVETLISYGYPSSAEALFKDVPILNHFFKDVSILGKIFKF